MRTTMRALATALLSAAMITPAAPAQATTTYQWLSCPAGTSTTGRIDTASARYDTPNGYYIAELSGVLDLCQVPPNVTYAFGLTRYGNEPATGSYKPYGFSVGRQRAFTEKISIFPVNDAVCVVSDPATRLACVSIAWSVIDGSLRPTVQGPLPIDDPRVDETATVWVYSPPVIGPGCPSCAG